MNKDRELAELLGLNPEYIKAERTLKYPGFIHNPVLVIKEMRKREDWLRFLERLGINTAYDFYIEAVPAIYLTTDGLLCDKAIRFMKEVKG